MTRTLVALIAGITVFAVVYAAAAGITVSSDDLGSGDVAVSKCDDNGFTTVSFTKDVGGNITQVTVGDIEADCVGGEMTVNLLDASNVSIGVGTEDTIVSPETTVLITGAPAHSDVKHVAAIVVGPE